MSEQNILKRLQWIDVFKGCGMILIVLGHTLRSGLIHNIVYYIHVPAFFFVSGITIKDKPINKTDATLLFKRLMIPYYFFGVISIAVYAILGKIAADGLEMTTTSGICRNIFDLLYGSSGLSFNGPLWFLPALFLTKVLYQLFYTLVRGNKKILFVLSIVGCILGFLYTDAGLIGLPFSFELVLKLFPFFIAGQMCKSLLISNQKKSLNCSIGAVVILPIVFIFAAFAPEINYTNNLIPNQIVFYLIAALGCVGLYCLSISIQKIRWIGFIGRKTLSILVMHKFPIIFLQVFGPFSDMLKMPNTIEGVLSGIIVTMFAIASSIAIGLIVEKICPVFLGISRQEPKVSKLSTTPS